MNMIGARFGKLIPVQQIKIDGRSGAFFLCDCDCGGTTIAYSGHLRAGQRISCGCVRGANRTHGMSHSPEYRAWDNARSRCYSPNNRKYPDYGGRGITMCDEWRRSFQSFIDDMGRRPSGKHSLDRINNDGPYSKDNCRWATGSEQNRNRRPMRARG